MNIYASTESLMFINHRPECTFVRGDGSWIHDSEGRKYLDFVQGWAVNSLGHNPKVVRDALQAQAGRVINVGPGYYNAPMIELADLLVQVPGSLACFSPAPELRPTRAPSSLPGNGDPFGVAGRMKWWFSRMPFTAGRWP